MNALAVFLLLLLFIGLLRPIKFLVYLVFVYPVFGSLSLLPTEAIGGVTILPGSVAALFLVIKVLLSDSGMKDAFNSLIDIRRLAFLGLFLLVGVLGAFWLPYIFEGTVRVYTMKSTYPEFISPSMSNFTQAVYLTLSTLVAVAVSSMMRKPAFVDALLKAILVGGYAIIATGVMDIVANAVGASAILSYFRTSSYTFMVDDVVEGTRRIIGLMPEASSYGGLAAVSCALLLFLRPAFPTRLWRWKVSVAAWGCGIMAFLSTSSTAYVAMASVLSIYAFYRIQWLTPDGNIKKKALVRKMLGVVTAVFAVLLLLLIDSDLAAHVAKLIDTLIFQKQTSSSYAERSSWTNTAFDGFLASGGLGLGVGSVRTSNFFVNILASTGILGASLFGLFLWIVFTRRAPPSQGRANVIIYGSKLSLIPMFLGFALAGTTPDFGVTMGILFGVITGSGQAQNKTAWISPLLRNKSTAPSLPVRPTS